MNIQNSITVEGNNFSEKFKNGSGNSLNFDVGIEHWLNEKLSISAKLHFSSMRILASKTTSFPFETNENLVLDNIYSESNNFTSFSIHGKYIIFENVGIGMGVGHNLAVSNSHEYELKVLKPEWYNFKNGSKSNTVFNDINDEIQGFSFITFKVEYQIELKYPIYISPYFEYQQSLTSLNKNYDLYISSFNFGLNLNYGISNLKLF